MRVVESLVPSLNSSLSGNIISLFCFFALSLNFKISLMLFMCNSKIYVQVEWILFKETFAGECMARRKPMEEDLREKAHAMYEEFVKILNSKFRMLRMELTHKRNVNCLISGANVA